MDHPEPTRSRLHVGGVELSVTSASTDSWSPRLLVTGHDPDLGRPATLWLYFEPVPELYAARHSIGLAKDGPRTWVYLEPRLLDLVVPMLEPAGTALIEHSHVPFAGGPAGARLVTGLQIANGPVTMGLGDLDQPHRQPLLAGEA